MSIAAAIVSDAVARLVAIQEAIECGDPSVAHAMASDLEMDLAGALTRASDEGVRLDDFNAIANVDAA